MDERIRICCCVLGGGMGFALLGAGFGALARVLYRASGRAAGGTLGAAAVQVLEQVTGPLSEPVRSAVSGAAEGACFLGVCGLLLGAYLGYSGPEQAQWLLPILLAGAVLALAAVLFGTAGYILVRGGLRAVGLLFAGAFGGGVLGLVCAGGDGLLLGVLGGGALGLLIGLVVTWRRPLQERSHGGEDE